MSNYSRLKEINDRADTALASLRLVEEMRKLKQVADAAATLRDRMCEAESLDTSYDVTVALVALSSALGALGKP